NLQAFAKLLRWQPVALDARGHSDQRFGLPGIDVDADEQFTVKDAAGRRQPHAAAADHDPLFAAGIAPANEPIGERRVKRAQQWRTPGVSRGVIRRLTLRLTLGMIRRLTPRLTPGVRLVDGAQQLIARAQNEI